MSNQDFLSLLARFYCLPENVTAGNPTSGYHDCPAGYYCANGTGLDWKPCPRGTYSMQTNLFRVEQCKDCDGGFYCDMEAATNVSGMCMAGYYCESGVDRPNPNNAAVNSTWPATCPLLGGHTGKQKLARDALNPFLPKSSCFQHISQALKCTFGEQGDNDDDLLLRLHFFFYVCPLCASHISLRKWSIVTILPKSTCCHLGALVVLSQVLVISVRVVTSVQWAVLCQTVAQLGLTRMRKDRATARHALKVWELLLKARKHVALHMPHACCGGNLKSVVHQGKKWRNYNSAG